MAFRPDLDECQVGAGDIVSQHVSLATAGDEGTVVTTSGTITNHATYDTRCLA